MMVEAALCLALQEEELPVQHGGFMSTAAGLGNVLVERLRKSSPGMRTYRNNDNASSVVAIQAIKI